MSLIPRMVVLISVMMFVLILFFPATEVQSWKQRMGVSHRIQQDHVQRSGRVVHGMNSSSLEVEGTLPLERCLRETAFLFFGDSTIRGMASCMLDNVYNEGKNRLQGDVHHSQQFIDDGYRVYFQYYPQLVSAFHEIRPALKYHRGEPPSGNTGSSNASRATAPGEPIDYFEALHRAYRKHGARRRVVVLVGGVALNVKTIDAVFQWRAEHSSNFHIIVKRNGPRLPAIPSIRSEHARMCFGDNTTGYDESEVDEWCPRLHKWKERYMENNEKLRDVVMQEQARAGHQFELEWMDVNEQLYETWPSGVKEDHCMCHYFLQDDPDIECLAGMDIILEDFVSKACAA